MKKFKDGVVIGKGCRWIHGHLQELEFKFVHLELILLLCASHGESLAERSVLVYIFIYGACVS